jgi:hypothetical protein
MNSMDKLQLTFSGPDVMDFDAACLLDDLSDYVDGLGHGFLTSTDLIGKYFVQCDPSTSHQIISFGKSLGLKYLGTDYVGAKL